MANTRHSGRYDCPNQMDGNAARSPAGAARASIYVNVLTFLAATLVATTALAAPSDLTGLSLEQLLNVEVSSASKFPQKVSDAPSAVSIVTAIEIKAYGYRTLADVLQSIRGLYVTNDRNYSYLGVRGFSRPGDYNSRILLLVDGFRVNDPIYGGGLIGTSFNVDVDLIERVEFVPGPGSAVYGSNAFFGVVNVVTKTGQGIDRTEASAELASHDTTKARVSHGQRYANGLDMLVSATTYHRSGQDIYFPEFDTPASNNGVAQDLDHDRYKQFFYKVSNGAFSLETAYSRRTKAIPTASYGQLFNDPRSATTDEQAFVDLKYSDRLSDTLQVNANAYVGYYFYEGSYVYPGTLPPATIVNNDESRGDWWGGELRFLSTALAHHKLVFGAEYRNNSRQDQRNFDADPSYFIYLDDKRNSSVSGIYVQDEYMFSDLWTINAGMRYDHTSQGMGDNVFNPRLAVIYKPQVSTSYKLLYGTAFRSPNVLERYYGTVAGGYKENLDLGPEKIKTLEAVLERYVSNDLRVTGSIFWYQTKDLISLMLDPADGLLIYRNLDQSEARGVELEGERRWGNNQRLRMSYTWQLVENTDTGARLSNSPQQMMKLNYSTPVFSTDWRAGLEAQYMDKRSTPFGNIVGGRTLANITLVSSALTRNLEVSATLYNVFDRRYGDVPSQEHFDSLNRNLNEISQDGRSFRLKLSYGF